MRGAGEHPPCSWWDEPASNIPHQGRPAFCHPLLSLLERQKQQHLRDTSTERTLCDPMDCSPPGSSVSRQESRSGLPCSPPGMEPRSLRSPALAGGFFATSTTWEAGDSLRQGPKRKSAPA